MVSLMIKELVKSNRTVRRYLQDKPISDALIRNAIDTAAYVASAANLQRIRYGIINDDRVADVYKSISLGGYFAAEDKPGANEAPAAYVFVFAPAGVKDPNVFIDAGIGAQTLTLALAESGVRTCMIRSFERDELSDLCPEGYETLMIVALGYPAESVRIIDAIEHGSIRYFRDSDGVHVVPKYGADYLILPI